jgi:L-fuculose-phosphate aldolase
MDELERTSTKGTSGNISARYEDVITPSATPFDSMKPEMIAAMPLEGDCGSWKGPLGPSMEWRFSSRHHSVEIRRGGNRAHALDLRDCAAIARKEIPACNYMMAAFGCPTVRRAEYARYGTKELSDFALKVLKDATPAFSPPRNDRTRRQPR